MPGDDAVLVRRSRAGDGEAFGLLFEQYKNLVYRNPAEATAGGLGGGGR